MLRGAKCLRSMRSIGYLESLRLLASRLACSSAVWTDAEISRDSDGTATAAANGDLPVPKDCQARAACGIARTMSGKEGI